MGAILYFAHKPDLKTAPFLDFSHVNAPHGAWCFQSRKFTMVHILITVTNRQECCEDCAADSDRHAHPPAENDLASGHRREASYGRALTWFAGRVATLGYF